MSDRVIRIETGPEGKRIMDEMLKEELENMDFSAFIQPTLTKEQKRKWADLLKDPKLYENIAMLKARRKER